MKKFQAFKLTRKEMKNVLGGSEGNSPKLEDERPYYWHCTNGQTDGNFFTDNAAIQFAHKMGGTCTKEFYPG